MFFFSSEDTSRFIITICVLTYFYFGNERVASFSTIRWGSLYSTITFRTIKYLKESRKCRICDFSGKPIEMEYFKWSHFYSPRHFPMANWNFASPIYFAWLHCRLFCKMSPHKFVNRRILWRCKKQEGSCCCCCGTQTAIAAAAAASSLKRAMGSRAWARLHRRRKWCKVLEGRIWFESE